MAPIKKARVGDLAGWLQPTAGDKLAYELGIVAEVDSQGWATRMRVWGWPSRFVEVDRDDVAHDDVVWVSTAFTPKRVVEVVQCYRPVRTRAELDAFLQV